VGTTGSQCAHPRFVIWYLIVQLVNPGIQREDHDDDKSDNDENGNGEGHYD